MNEQEKVIFVKARRIGVTRLTSAYAVVRYVSDRIDELVRLGNSPSRVIIGYLSWDFLGKPESIMGLPVTVSNKFAHSVRVM